jgi:hypothetical protein
MDGIERHNPVPGTTNVVSDEWLVISHEDGWNDVEVPDSYKPPGTPYRMKTIIEIGAIGLLSDQISVSSAVELQFSTKVGLRYQLESSQDLKLWLAWGDPFDGNGRTTTQLLSVKGLSQTFWRLRQIAP